MKKILVVGLIAVFLGFAGVAGAMTVTATSGNLAAEAIFTQSGSDLVVKLSNTSTYDVMNPAEVLTALFFTINGATLTPVSAVLAPGSTTYFGPTNSNVGGEWAYASGLGISSTGLGLFGSGNFNGPNLQGPNSVDGLQYGLTSAGDNLSTGNAAVTGGFALTQNSVVFTLSGLPTDYDFSKITNISFQYGTALTEPNLPPDNHKVPEPGTLMLLGSGLLGLGFFGRKKFAK